jgi:hypothetical protein
VTYTPEPIGPEITFFGLAEANGQVPPTPLEQTEDGAPVYHRTVPQGFLIVVEAKKGASRASVGTSTFNWDPNDPEALPDFQIVSSRPLGDGSVKVCDDMPGNLGGVPAVDPPVFSGTQAVANALNDFGCRFDVRGASSDACTKAAVTMDPSFVSSDSSKQFCSSPGVGTEIGFPTGERTRLTVRIKDVAGYPGLPSAIVVEVPSP